MSNLEYKKLILLEMLKAFARILLFGLSALFMILALTCVHFGEFLYAVLNLVCMLAFALATVFVSIHD